jgi:hypothetical protein
MDRRYDLLADAKVRDIDGYREKLDAGGLDPEGFDRFPYIVVLVDELNDLMMVAGREVEEAIVRIAQMARAVGIHLVIATQRPSVDVITGVIKANVPSPSRLQRRLPDRQPGHPRLGRRREADRHGRHAGGHRQGAPAPADPGRLGAGGGDPRRRRLGEGQQEARYEDQEVLEAAAAAAARAEEEDDEDAELIRQAMELVVRSQLGSTSMLQRKLRIGFARAGRVMDILERMGVVGPSEAEGDFHEAMNFAAVYATPTVFVCQNNGWAISMSRAGQTRVGDDRRSKADAYGMPGVLVDGNDALSMLRSRTEAVERARAGEGPTLIEALTYRIGPHTTADDAGRYRSDDDVEAWRKRIRSSGSGPTFAQAAGGTRRGSGRPRRPASAEIEAAVSGPRRSNRSPPTGSPRPDVRDKPTGASRPSGVSAGGDDVTEMTMAQALNDALDIALGRRPGGADRRGHRGTGGVFRVTDGLHERHGSEGDRHPGGRVGDRGCRLRDGGRRPAAGRRDPVPRVRLPGVRPDRQPCREDPQPVEPPVHRPDGHPHPLRGRHRRRRASQRVVRGDLRPHPGIKVVVPGDPADAKGLLLAAIEDPDPVVFLEPIRVYRAIKEEVPEGHYTVPIGVAEVVRRGSDVTIVSYGAVLRDARAPPTRSRPTGCPPR